MTIHNYGFNEQYRWSEGTQVSGGVHEILFKHIPGVERIEKAAKEEDKKGTDYWVYRKKIDGRLSIDVKARSVDPIPKYGKDDLCLEIMSVVETQKPGWTLDESKQTDFILWFFKPTKRFLLLPFVQLLAVSKEHIAAWEEKYQTNMQASNNGEWHSKSVFVPRTVVLEAITKRFYGNPEVKES